MQKQESNLGFRMSQGEESLEFKIEVLELEQRVEGRVSITQRSKV